MTAHAGGGEEGIRFITHTIFFYIEEWILIEKNENRKKRGNGKSFLYSFLEDLKCLKKLFTFHKRP